VLDFKKPLIPEMPYAQFQSEGINVRFSRSLKHEFRGSKLTQDSGYGQLRLTGAFFRKPGGKLCPDKVHFILNEVCEYG
jgi:uncharacterized protein YutD